MATKSTAERTARRVNELYWNSKRTISEITAETGVTRNALYSQVEPVPAGARCATCEGPLVFTTRTNRTSGMSTCESCGVTTRPVREGEEAGGTLAPVLRGRARGTLLPGRIGKRRAAMIGGSAALGAVVGAVATRTIRK